ncbi:hypothetical protein CFC21_014439 [Triticum aestivum]|uniref:rRNA N-glycosylase n=2 Tax=Triticum aestivum TaxID=4565 RepID=A0A9R1IZH9_WHEAT|nr:hypothetical protein CFC21_014439 [Triticum aestivum]
MTQNYQDLLTLITNHITQIWQNLHIEGNGLIEEVQTLPKGAGFFIIELLAPLSWIQDNDGPVRLLFSFDNLYCIGFFRNENWFIFSDHYKDMKDVLEGTIARPLSFSGNYNKLNADFFNIHLGVQALFQTYKGIAGYPGSLIKVPLLTSCITFSEPLRFPAFRQYMISKMSTYDSPPGSITEFSIHFTNWSNYCDIIREGRAQFDPLNAFGIQSYDDLLGLVGMIL